MSTITKITGKQLVQHVVGTKLQQK